jgi:hypothetical protein
MPMALDRMWELLHEGSDELAGELGLEAPPSPFDPRSLDAVDDHLAAEPRPLDENALARLGLFLARVLVETHRGGLTLIRAPGHPLDGEWALTAFERGLAADFHVPFFVAATRIAEGQLTARDWYRQVLEEGGPNGPHLR